MAKTTTPERLSDTGLAVVVWPAKVKLRCDHAGMQLADGHEPDIGEPTLDGQILLRQLYIRRCDLFGKVAEARLAGVDDADRACPHCGFYRTIVGPA